MTSASGSFLKRFFFLLLVILVISCSGEHCIEADDFGEYNIDTIDVPSVTPTCTWVETGEGIGYGDEMIEECLINGKKEVAIKTFKIVISPKNSHPKTNAGCLAFLEDAEDDKYEVKCDAELSAEDFEDCKANLSDVVQETSNIVSSAYDMCKMQCIIECQENSTSDSSVEPTWISSNHPGDTGGSYGIKLDPSRKIQMQVEGKIDLVTAQNKKIKIKTNSSLLQDKGMDLSQGDSLSFNLGGEWCDCEDANGNTIDDCNIGNKCGNGRQVGEFFNSNYSYERENIGTRTEFFRRLVAYLKEHPEGYAADESGKSTGVPIDPIFSAWYCNYNTDTINSTHEFECGTDYSRTTYFSDLGRDTNDDYVTIANELYAIEDTNEKYIGGTVIPSSQLKMIKDPFKELGCRTTETSSLKEKRECTYSDGALFTETENGYLVDSYQKVSEGVLELQLNKPAKIAVKIIGDDFGASAGSGTCSLKIFVDGVELENSMNTIDASEGWKILKDGNGQGKELIINKFSSVKNPAGKTVTLSTNEMESWITSNNNRSIDCGQGMAVRILYLNELLINTSGFVRFKIFGDDPNIPASGAVGNCKLNFSIINPAMVGDGNSKSDFIEESKEINVPANSTNWTSRIFVRKGQVLRFDYSNWERINDQEMEPQTWMSEGGLRQCGVGMLMKIVERPAVICLGMAEEVFLHPNCTRKFDSEGSLIGCVMSPFDYCASKKERMCPMGCIKKANGDIEGIKNSVTSCHKEGDTYNETNITTERCKKCAEYIENLETTADTDIVLYAPQCYNLEDYIGHIDNINTDSSSDDLKGTVNEHGLLTVKNYQEGARKLTSLSGGARIGSLESFELNPIFVSSGEEYDYYYSPSMAATQVVPYDTRVKFMILDGDNFYNEFEDHYDNNRGSCLINMTPTISFKNGKQLAVALAHKDWIESVDGTNSDKFKGWIVRFDENDRLHEEETDYYFDPNGILRKQNFDSDILEFVNETNYNITDIEADNMRLFFKIIDVDKGDEDCEPKRIKDGENCINRYYNNFGTYRVRMKSPKTTKDLLGIGVEGANINTIVKSVMQPIMETLDGKTVFRSVNKTCDIEHYNPEGGKCYTKNKDSCTSGGDCFKTCTEYGDADCEVLKWPAAISSNLCAESDKNCFLNQNGRYACNFGESNCYKKCTYDADCDILDFLNKKGVSKTKKCRTGDTCYFAKGTDQAGNSCSPGESNCYKKCPPCKVLQEKLAISDELCTAHLLCFDNSLSACGTESPECYKKVEENCSANCLNKCTSGSNCYESCQPAEDDEDCAEIGATGVGLSSTLCTDINEKCNISCKYMDKEERTNEDKCEYQNDGRSLVSNFYKNLVQHPTYKNVLNISMTLMIMFFGFGYLLGLVSLKQDELLTRLLKIGIIYLFVSETGWNVYNAIFVDFFKAGIDYVVFAVAGAFDETNTIDAMLQSNDFYDKSVLFSGIDRNIMLLFSHQVQAKIWGLFFVSFFGFIYVFLIFSAILSYIAAVANALLLYITAQVFISILLALGPIFFIFLLFNKTKGMFDRWLNNLISFSLQQIFLLTVFGFFNILVYDIFKFVLSYPVCWAPVITFRLPVLGNIEALSFWKITGSYSGADPQSVGSSFPGLFHILIIYLVAKVMKEFIIFVTNLAKGIADRDSLGLTDLTSGTRGMVDKAYNLASGVVKNEVVEKVWKPAQSKYLGVLSDEEKKKIDATNKKKRDVRTKAYRAANEVEKKWKVQNAAKHAKMLNAAKTPEERKKVREKIAAEGLKIRKNKVEDIYKKAGFTKEDIKESGGKLYRSEDLAGLTWNALKRSRKKDKAIRKKDIISLESAPTELSTKELKTAMRNTDSKTDREGLARSVDKGYQKIQRKQTVKEFFRGKKRRDLEKSAKDKALKEVYGVKEDGAWNKAISKSKIIPSGVKDILKIKGGGLSKTRRAFSKVFDKEKHEKREREYSAIVNELLPRREDRHIAYTSMAGSKKEGKEAYLKDKREERKRKRLQRQQRQQEQEGEE